MRLAVAAVIALVAAAPASAGVGAVVFSTDHGNVYEWSAATNAVTLVAQGDWPRLSPDGTMIAFHRVAGGPITGDAIAHANILVRRLATGDETTVFRATDWTDAYSWIGNDHLVFDTGCDIAIAGIETTTTESVPHVGCFADAPSVGPDQTLYFAESPGGELASGIYAQRNAAVTQIFVSPAPEFAWPSLSPDATRLVFWCGNGSICTDDVRGAPAIATIGHVGSGFEMLNGAGPSSIAAAWAPDSRTVVAVGSANDLRLYPADGSDPVGTLLATVDPSQYGRIDWVGGVVAGGGPTSQTNVTATVAPTVTVSAPSAISFPPLAVGMTSDPITAPVTVTSNAPFGYQLSVTRTAFDAGDIPLAIAASAAPAGATLALSGATAIAPGAPTSIGQRSASMTDAAGDTWQLAFVLGPVPFVASGLHRATVTYTVVGL